MRRLGDGVTPGEGAPAGSTAGRPRPSTEKSGSPYPLANAGPQGKTRRALGVHAAVTADGVEDRVVGVVGLGAVGLPLGALFSEDEGLEVVLHDASPERMAALADGRTPLAHLEGSLGETLRRRCTLAPEPEALGRCDALLICVPTPLDGDREPDLGAVRAASALAARHARPGALIVLESTTWPGTTREVVAAAFDPARECDFAYSPERVDPGRVDATRDDGDPLGRHVPKLVGGLTPGATARAAALYRRAFGTVVETASADVAEAAKLVENVYRAVNIALVGELKIAFERMGLDVWDVLDAAATKPFGFTRFDPGPGMGGHCLPIDPFYLAWAARRAGAETRFVELSGEINRAMPGYVARRTLDALEARGVDLGAARVLLLGVAYKRGVDITEESPAFPVAEALAARGVAVDYCDPLVPRCALGDAVALDDEVVGAYDAAVILVDQVGLDLGVLVRRDGLLVVDTRAALRHELGGDPRYVSA